MEQVIAQEYQENARKAGLLLPVMEAFYTIQGEGHFSGHAAYFIRLGGCDVGCTWCDVKESWDESAHPVLHADAIVAEALKFPARKAVITGGEPLMQNLQYLTCQLQAQGFATHIETSGTHPFTGEFDWVTFSPKKYKKPLEEIFDKAHELKVVVYHKSDFAWAEGYARLMGPECRLYLQPEWSKQAKMLSAIIDYVKENPKWQISLQTHKYMDIP